MLLYSFLRHAISEDSITDSNQELLFEASINFQRFAITMGGVAYEDFHKTYELIQKLEYPEVFIIEAEKFLDKNLLHERESRLIVAFICLCKVVVNLNNSKHQKFLSQIIQESKSLLTKTFSDIDSDGKEGKLIGELTFYISDYIKKYSEYGILPASTLGTALAQCIRDQWAIASNQLIPIRLLNNVDIYVSPFPQSSEAFIKGMQSKDINGIEGFEERSYSLLNNADIAAKEARMSKNITDFFEAVQIAHILFDSATRALSWILKRYENSSKSPSEDLYNERRVAEENRVQTLSILFSSGGSLICEPITDMIGATIMTNRQMEHSILNELALNGIRRNPAYPDILHHTWFEVINSLDILKHKQLTANEMSSLAPIIEKKLRNKFADSFSDKIIANKVTLIQDNTYFKNFSYQK
jgi:hypothetical protein